MGQQLFPVLRVAVDENRKPGRFLILGSASQELIRQSSETLAGRIHFIELAPFSYVLAENFIGVVHKSFFYLYIYKKTICVPPAIPRHD